jgi:phosphoribosylformylglycinamidine synthase subunit PurS
VDKIRCLPLQFKSAKIKAVSAKSAFLFKKEKMATAEIHVTLKPGLLDVQGKTVLKALQQLGHSEVQNVRIGKFITLEISDALAGPALQQELDRMCQQLLANPVIENYEIVVTATSGTQPGAAVTAPAPPTGVVAPLPNP